MFFTLSKVFWLFAEPVTFVILIGIAGIILGFTRFARAGRALQAVAILLLALALLTPFGALLIRPLEDRFPQPPADTPAPAAIIVLGGGMETDRSEARGQIYFTPEAARLFAGAELARRYPAARLVFTGGFGNLFREGEAEAAGVRRLWLSLGVPSERMTFEEKSRNTWENAIFTRELIKPKKGETFLLVTSAWHMPRAAGIFRHAGFEIVPYPVAYRSYGDNRDAGAAAATVPERLLMLDDSFREWIGLAAYRLTGKTDSFFPGP